MEIGVSITEIQFRGRFIVIVLEFRDSDISVLPQLIARCNCFYLYDDEMGRPSNQSALRLLEPVPGNPDDSEYDNLRPGVMLSSGKHPTEGRELLTSSGVLVQDDNGYQYMTCASHGFPYGGRVFHPNASRQEIGTVIIKLTHINIALVQLDNQISYTNEIFENTVVPGPSVRLQRFNTDEENRCRAGSDIFINSPFTGYIEGTQGMRAMCRAPTGNPRKPEQVWIKTRWDYMGQGSSDTLADGICGSALWNDRGNVVGFFRHAPKSGHFLGWCLPTQASRTFSKASRLSEDAKIGSFRSRIMNIGLLDMPKLHPSYACRSMTSRPACPQTQRPEDCQRTQGKIRNLFKPEGSARSDTG
ncbi:hypothetical protein MGYG_01308 [Nannizzia gypsea CBS 118893]|uniref:Uncharacterized protein n=1 Tax=Arthroderma gypseum (strain ATCC MYA-4604 / CBS 118893) TaxID=535722 RepID=E5R025_ARTGP|nr:hypothetical protein MGYG_01308 [Nannizzia gypsea CBS 118893]EFQ98274.1 hypothetical protein MGYG_01308 [Nannizzia gypsea CBS 118893]